MPCRTAPERPGLSRLPRCGRLCRNSRRRGKGRHRGGDGKKLLAVLRYQLERRAETNEFLLDLAEEETDAEPFADRVDIPEETELLPGAEFYYQAFHLLRSEERRVGKSVDLGG